MKTLSLKLLAITWMCTASTLANASTDVYEKTLSGVAFVSVGNGYGTGWVIDREKKLLLTCQHVVGANREVEIYFPMYRAGCLLTDRKDYADVKPIKGRVLLADARRDLALVELDSLPADAKALPLAPASAKPASDLHSVGCPGAGAALWTYSFGKVRNVTRMTWHDAHSHRRARIVESQLPISPGDSGGPVVNDRGEIVGMNSCVGLRATLFTYAIDLTEIKSFMANSGKTIAANKLLSDAKRCVGEKKMDEAIITVKEALKRDAENLNALSDLAQIYIAMNEFDRTIEVCRTILKLDDEYFPAWNDLGYALLKTKDYKLAVQALNKAISIDKTQGLTYDRLIAAYEALGDAENAGKKREEKKKNVKP